jgi:hypothetical protein
VSDPYRAYSRERYIAAVGFAANRAEAEKKSLAALTAVFGQSIQSDFSTVTIYSEAISKGIVTVSENTSVRNTIATAAALDILIGAEIANVWDDGRGMVYALAHVEKEKTAAAYTEMIRMNLANIEKLTAMNAAEKNTFDGYARYKLAALISGLNTRYANVAAQAGGSPSALNLTNTDSLNLETANIVKNISVAVNVAGDSGSRVRDAFAKALSGEGLRTQGGNTPYTLDVNVSLSEAVFPNNTNKFCRFTVSANLIEKVSGSVLLPFSISDRAGHSTYEGAETAAIAAIEKTVIEKYPGTFREYLAALLPLK